MKEFKQLLLIVLIAALFACNQQPQQQAETVEEIVLSDSLVETYKNQSRQIIQATFKALSSNLMQAMSYGGVPYALEFCNVEALPITDSVAAHFGAEISRLALKNRNPENYPDGQDEALLKHFQQVFDKGLAVGDTLILVNNNELAYYAPIMLAEQCLTCHGTVGGEITVGHYQAIQRFYPEDKAVGFGTGDLRGFWRIGYTFAAN